MAPASSWQLASVRCSRGKPAAAPAARACRAGKIGLGVGLEAACRAGKVGLGVGVEVACRAGWVRGRVRDRLGSGLGLGVAACRPAACSFRSLPLPLPLALTLALPLALTWWACAAAACSFRSKLIAPVLESRVSCARGRVRGRGRVTVRGKG